MKNISFDTSEYDPSDHRSNLSGVYSGFALLMLTMIGLFLL